jgi:hypothetical protein
MSDAHGPIDPGALWRSQRIEDYQMNVHRIVNRRARELYSRTRAEVITSVTAPLLFIAVVAWRFGFASDRVVEWGFALIITWIAISLYAMRRRIWGPREPAPDAAAAASMDYYRHELQERRDHLRSLWMWHGPMVLACIVFLAAVLGRVWPVYRHMLNALPFVALLLAWSVLNLWKRRRQARELQRELDELDQLRRSET